MQTFEVQLCAEYGTIEPEFVLAPALETVIIGANTIMALTIACLIFICFLSLIRPKLTRADLNLVSGENFLAHFLRICSDAEIADVTVIIVSDTDHQMMNSLCKLPGTYSSQKLK
jgi:hypothetical protein